MEIIALGSNIDGSFGTPRDSVSSALSRLAAVLGPAQSISAYYSTPAFPPGNGADFVNAVAIFASGKSPEAVLAHLHEIEAEAGRVRGTRWAPRALDLDLVALGDTIRPDTDHLSRWLEMPLEEQTVSVPETLLLPHPRLQDRAFVLVPMADVAPDWCHPITGLTTLQMLAALPEATRAEVVPL